MSGRRLAQALLLACPLLLPACGKKGGGRGVNAAAAQARDPLARDNSGGAVAQSGLNAPAGNTAAIRTTVVNFTIDDQSIAGPDTVPEGSVEIHVVNRGQSVHEVQLLQLAPTASVAEVLSIVGQQKVLPRGITQQQGGAGPLSAGRSMSVVQLLVTPGRYLVVDPLPSADGTLWYAMGLIRVLIVTGVEHAPWQQPPLIRSKSMISANGFAMRFGATLTRGDDRSLLIEGRWRFTQIERGDNIIKIEYRGGFGHDLVLVKTGDPMSMRAYVDWLSHDRSVPPDGLVGGIPGMFPPNSTFYIKVHLDPGTYTVFCSKVTADGQMDFELGESDQFLVY